MSVPKLRFKEFGGDWQESSIGQLTKYFKGYAFKSESYKDNGVRIIRVSDLGRDSIKYDNEAIYLDKVESYDYENWMLKEHDIVITTVGSKPHLVDSAVGRPIYIRNNNEGLLNQNLLVLRPINQKVESYFIFSQLLDNKYLTHIETIQRGNANQSNITVKDLQEFKVFSAPKPEQTKIASFLSSVDEKISLLTQKHKLLSQYKQGMMQKLFSQQIRFKADDGSEFGEWEETTLGQTGKFIGGGTPSKENSEFWEGSIPWISSSDLTEESIFEINITRFISQNALNQSATKLVPSNSILIVSRVGVGKVAITSHEICTSQDFTSLALHKGSSIFFAYLIKSLTPYLLEMNQGTSIKGFVKDDLANLELKVPCLEEQTKIANFLSRIDQKIEVVAQQIEQAKLWKKGLLQQMFV
ncbi:restriction endonuclease subunit S [uncultured Acinetobacter sp.]|uniref:restriction endonuclease subunit S n=1 Tax=uncultured Acinetobacter sp. TaxID=165433 RepID=UPI00374A7C85